MKIGEALEPLEATADPAAMKTMAALLRDPNMIHLDPAAAEALGLGPRVVNQGPISMGWVHTMLARAAGGPENVLSTRIRFHDVVFGGERVIAGGEVTAIVARRGERGVGRGVGPRKDSDDLDESRRGDVVECAVWLDVQRPDGPVRALSGTARLKG
ncbi:MaoC family dehydratase [Pseudonocardia endophytica]|uniref:MaoC dehydratase-like protein n=1 Tax=Pseudonocardia endophytica TaxID=401976 RepID=A0A4R1HRI5_PSEEN|nr:MaoC family dehydratase [Pseudonocardia endophytica]TCK22409.1 MaoC dehydratase-like protein [Pseudonocardia endophytica]